jgi:hypothetical protein
MAPIMAPKDDLALAFEQFLNRLRDAEQAVRGQERRCRMQIPEWSTSIESGWKASGRQWRVPLRRRSVSASLEYGNATSSISGSQAVVAPNGRIPDELRPVAQVVPLRTLDEVIPGFDRDCISPTA